ncbi:TPA: hypothetical protein P0E34_004535 [Vibrio campbellii]|nr:hypothetical protein [Vibrio campbellii]HDM8219888.1 hypothetical protein [Vibrio campbellii]
MTQQNPILTLSKCQAATNVSPLERESSPKNDSSLVLCTERGFAIATGSDISPKDLKEAGFTMRDFKFYPSSLPEIKKRLPSFVVLDLSKSNERIYSFDRCPF